MMMHRKEFPAVFDRLGVKSVVEVGVGSGDFARVILQSNIDRYVGVDHWLNPADADRKAKAMELLSDPRVQIIEKPSHEASYQFADGSIDCVYVDAQHDYESVYSDLVRWWPKCRVMIAGHDYGLWNHAVNCPFGVIPAVERFAQGYGLEINVTGSPSTSPADRLLAAYNALFAEPGVEGDNIPSFWIMR